MDHRFHRFLQLKMDFKFHRFLQVKMVFLVHSFLQVKRRTYSFTVCSKSRWSSSLTVLSKSRWASSFTVSFKSRRWTSKFRGDLVRKIQILDLYDQTKNQIQINFRQQKRKLQFKNAKNYSLREKFKSLNKCAKFYKVPYSTLYNIPSSVGLVRGLMFSLKMKNSWSQVMWSGVQVSAVV